MSENPAIGNIRRFGPYSLNPVTIELRRDDARVRLQPQPLRILILLTERPGELLTREEIRRAIWGDHVHLEFEPALNFAIGQIRTALRDSASNPVYIETVPKVGYRFVARMEGLAPSTVEVASQKGMEKNSGIEHSGPSPQPQSANEDEITNTAEPEPPSLRRGQRSSAPTFAGHRQTLVAISSILLVAVVLLGFRKWHSVALERNSTSVVVLPFVNLTGDPSNEYLADGLTEETIARLAIIGGGHLRVIARTSSMFYKSRAVTAKKVGSELGVSYVLESSFRREGTGLQVTMQLVRAADESHVWTKVLSTAPDQIFVIIGSTVSEVLKSLPLPEADSQAKQIYVSASIPAHDQYLRGQQFLWLRTRDGLYKALDSFRSAVSADPSYAQAYAQLATTYNLLGQYGWMEQREAAELGEEAANRSLSLDETSADAHAARGFSRWFYKWDWIAGEQDFQDALRSDPSNTNALHWYALALATEGHFHEARRWMDRALTVDPKSQILQTNRGWIEYLAGHPEEAARRMEVVLKDDPGFLSAHNKLWSVYSVQKQDAKAFSELRFILPYSVAPDREQKILVAYQTSGYSASMHEWLRSPPEIGRGNSVDLARVALFAEEREQAVNILMDGYRSHDGWIVFMLSDPAFKDLRDDPRITSMARDLESRQQQQVAPRDSGRSKGALGEGDP